MSLDKPTRNTLVIEKVIKLTLIREEPKRVVIQYYSTEGEFLFELDSID